MNNNILIQALHLRHFRKLVLDRNRDIILFGFQTLNSNNPSVDDFEFVADHDLTQSLSANAQAAFKRMSLHEYKVNILAMAMHTETTNEYRGCVSLVGELPQGDAVITFYLDGSETMVTRVFIDKNAITVGGTLDGVIVGNELLAQAKALHEDVKQFANSRN